MRSPRVLALLCALGMASGVAACGSDESSSGGSGSKEPLRVALIPPTSGALSVFGDAATKAWELAAEEVNAAGGVDGHEVQITKYATDGTPAGTVRAARKAATERQAHFIGAVMTSPEHGALAKQLVPMNSLNLNGLGQDDALTGESCSPNHFRAVANTTMGINAVAASLSKLPVKRWAIQAVDFSTGHTAAKVFKAAAEKAGQEVVLESYAPLNTTEFGSYIAKLRKSGADGMFVVEFGADGVAFVNQGAQFKLFDQYKTVLGFNMVSEPLFEALGKKVTGFFNNLGYDVGADNPLNRRFVAAYEKKHGTRPFQVPADNYVAAQMLFEAVRKAGGVDPAKVRKTMSTLSFDSIAGPVQMSPDGQLVRDAYLAQVVEQAGGPGGLGWKVTASAPGKQIHPGPDPACKVGG